MPFIYLYLSVVLHLPTAVLPERDTPSTTRRLMSVEIKPKVRIHRIMSVTNLFNSYCDTQLPLHTVTHGIGWMRAVDERAFRKTAIFWGVLRRPVRAITAIWWLPNIPWCNKSAPLAHPEGQIQFCSTVCTVTTFAGAIPWGLRWFCVAVCLC